MGILTFEGGLNEQDVTLVKDQECIAGYNFELGVKDTHFRPRKPFDNKGTATNASPINGFIQLVTAADVETTLVQSGDTVYSWDGASSFTSKGTVSSSSRLRGTIWTLGGYSIITDIAKATVIKKWDGTSFTTLTTGLGADLYAKYGLVHLGRMWLFNVTSGTATPHLLVASAFETPTSYNTTLRAKDSSFSTGNEAFYMVTPDLRPINGAALFYGSLIISTEGGSLWRLSGTSSLNFQWDPFYPGSFATGTETMVLVGDDVLYMKKGGNIESVRSTDTYGDVKTDDVSRWIRPTVEDLTDAISVYDQQRQKVYFFAGSNKLLVLFKDMITTGLSPWSVYKTGHTSSFSTEAAIYMRAPGTDNYFVYFGDSVGNIYRLEGTGDGDNGDTDIEAYRRTKFYDDIEGFNPMLEQLRGRIYYRRVADVDVVMDFEWGEDYAINTCTVPLAGPPVGDSGGYWGGTGYFGGSFYWNSGFFYADRVSTKGFSPIGRGVGFHLELSITSSQLFDIMKIEV